MGLLVEILSSSLGEDAFISTSFSKEIFAVAPLLKNSSFFFQSFTDTFPLSSAFPGFCWVATVGLRGLGDFVICSLKVTPVFFSSGFFGFLLWFWFLARDCSVVVFVFVCLGFVVSLNNFIQSVVGR